MAVPLIAMPGHMRLLQILLLFCTVLSGVLLYPHVYGRCLYAWEERQSRIAVEEKAREREIHRQVDFVVGFYVGPSYSASVALFRNGTTLNLAKVDGDTDYQAAMERRIARADAVKAWYDYNEALPDERGRFGSSTPEELEKVFIPILQTLKERSETTLQQSIEHVHFATPWIAEFQQPHHDEDDTFLVARRRLGLKNSFVYDKASKIIMPLHLNEANAVLAAAGRKLCEECFCTERLWQQYSGRGSDIFYINLSYKSLFLSKQPGSCVFEAYWVQQLQLDTAYGLEQLQIQDLEEYWAAVKARVLSYIVPWYQIGGHKTTTILVAGEATSNLDFLSMAQSIREELLALRSDTSSEMINEYQPQQIIEGVNSVELIVAEDGVFDAAKGAALLMRGDFWGYCDGTDEYAMRLACHNHYERNGVEWSSWYQPSLPGYEYDENDEIINQPQDKNSDDLK